MKLNDLGKRPLRRASNGMLKRNRFFYGGYGSLLHER